MLSEERMVLNEEREGGEICMFIFDEEGGEVVKTSMTMPAGGGNDEDVTRR